MTFLNKWIMSVLVYIFTVYLGLTIFAGEDLLIYFVPIMLISALGITTSLTVNLILHYRDKSSRFFRSYLFLAIALGAYTLGELAWGILDILEFETYPSIADPFYFVYFGFSILFCIQMFWCRKAIIPWSIKAIPIMVGIATFVTYFILSYDHIGSEYYLLDSAFMVSSSVLIAAASVAVIAIWRAPQLRKVWVVIGAALILNSIADIFYYSDSAHFLYGEFYNIIWFGSALMFFYALYLHRFLYISDVRQG